MPSPGLIWRHITFCTHRAWLPGDPRGFRSRDHRIHSSGDYKHRPPANEHAGLHRWHQQRGASPVVLNPTERAIACEVFARFAGNDRLLVISVSGLHVHMLAQLSTDPAEARATVGDWKREASCALRDELPGKLWATGCGLKPIKDRSHHRRTFKYICDHIDEGAVVWRYDTKEILRP